MDFKTAEKALRDLIVLRETEPRRVIAVDVDGTIAIYKKWTSYLDVGVPVASVVESMRQEKAAGTYIIIHTCRVSALDGQVIPEAIDSLRMWLRVNDIPFDEIWLGTGKPYANEYWDDKAVRKP